MSPLLILKIDYFGSPTQQKNLSLEKTLGPKLSVGTHSGKWVVNGVHETHLDDDP